jgi:hypothetical protein
MSFEADPKVEAGAGLFASALLSAIIGGVGALLVVDRYPSLDVDEVFMTSWWVLFSLLSALFLLVGGCVPALLGGGEDQRPSACCRVSWEVQEELCYQLPTPGLFLTRSCLLLVCSSWCMW